MKCILIFFTVFYSLAAFSQDERRFFFGVNVGVKFANKNYAMRYNGIYPSSDGIGHLENTLLQQNNYNTIYQMLGDNTFQVPYDAYPQNIRYTPGLLTGVTMGYKLSPNLQLGIDADFSKLKVKSFYTIEVLDASNTTSQEQFQTGQLYAEESRFNGRLNFDYVSTDEKINYVIGLSGIFSSWRVDEHIAIFKDFKMPLHSVHNVNNNFSTRTSGSGFGYGINLGLEYRANDKIVCQLMYQPYFQRTEYYLTKQAIESLGSDYIKSKFRLEHDITLRILWK